MKFYDVEQLAELFELSPLTIRKWLRSGKIKGRKSGKEWKVTDEDLKEMFHVGNFYGFTFEDEETLEEIKPIIDVFGKDKLFKELYPEAHEQHEQNNYHPEPWGEFRGKCIEKLQRRFPFPYESDEIVCWSDDNETCIRANEPEAYTAYYSIKREEEQNKLDKLMNTLKVKHGLQDEDIDEIKRTYENIFLLTCGEIIHDK